MNINDISYGCRFTDEKYAIFSEKELSEIKVLTEEEAKNSWYKYCDNEILELSYFVKDIVAHKLHFLINDCSWGDELGETKTKQLLKTELRQYEDGYINVCYESKKALRVSTKLFCDRWNDFCYPSDSLILDLGDRALLYYEDLIYYLEKKMV